LFLANEGKMVLFCPEAESDKVLSAMKAERYGKDATVIGRVRKTADQGRLIMISMIGGLREVTIPSGELLPRIC